MLNRDARHIALEQVGSEGQQRISEGSVLLIGIGGLGCAAATYLASSGVGHIRIADFDTVDETNLGRQVLYAPGDVGKLKVTVARERLLALNPDVMVSTNAERLQGDALQRAVADADIVMDGSDNFTTRFEVNEACVRARKPLISGAAIRCEGQLAVFGPDYRSSPCYRCLYAEADESLDSCAGNGVLAPVPGIIGTMMATEVLKLLVGIGGGAPKLHLFDAATVSMQSLTIEKRGNCPVCSA